MIYIKKNRARRLCPNLEVVAIQRLNCISVTAKLFSFSLIAFYVAHKGLAINWKASIYNNLIIFQFLLG